MDFHGSFRLLCWLPLDLVTGALLSFLMGWHGEFLRSFPAKLVPGVELVPLWTLAVVQSVYRMSKHSPATIEGICEDPATIKEPRSPQMSWIQMRPRDRPDAVHSERFTEKVPAMEILQECFK